MLDFFFPILPPLNTSIQNDLSVWTGFCSLHHPIIFSFISFIDSVNDAHISKSFCVALYTARIGFALNDSCFSYHSSVIYHSAFSFLIISRSLSGVVSYLAYSCRESQNFQYFLDLHNIDSSIAFVVEFICIKKVFTFR